MATKCFMCGREISNGILCEKCDKPRRPKTGEFAAISNSTATVAIPAVTAPTPASPPAPPQPAAAAPVQQPVASAPPAKQPSPAPAPPAAAAPASAPNQTRRSSEATARDPFPKAPILPFPVESASPAITSIVNVLIASGVASILLGADRSVKFVSDEARRLFDAAPTDINVKFIESKTGVRIGDLSVSTSAGVMLRHRNILYSLIPLTGGASGAVLVFRSADGSEAHPSFGMYVRETIFGPLRALHDSFLAAGRTRPRDPLLEDAAATLDQVLSSLELAPGVEETSSMRPLPTVTDVVQRVADRFVAFADLKGINLQVDAQELEERFHDHEQLADSLAILMDNALHYVPPGGQVVVGARWMEHKGRPLLLFFVMDNGAVVPETLRQAIFEPSFVWDPSSPERTGRGLFKCREFAVAHAGSVWVESKTGKACTFFLRVRPDSAR
jgi:hypothetical protein